MARIIKGNQDREGGGNDTYRIPGRGSSIPRRDIVREVEQGKHPDYSTYTIDGEKYVRGNPDGSDSNNVNS